ncbi:hypothetical protein B4U84_11070 [Westiellopsis prolifica IICB1]|nr:hypothetical protein B4U84_11070 [Westiellopsis prolifica IICB1]
MKRNIYLVIAFALSFLMMFAISWAGKTQVQAQTPLLTSEQSDVEIVKVRPVNASKAVSSLTRTTVNDEVAQEAKAQILKSINLGPQCNVPCPGGAAGYMSGNICFPC